MKNNLELNFRKAEQEASSLIEQYGITSPDHIRLKDIAFDKKVTVVEGELKGAAASLVRTGEYATIRVDKDERNEYRKRFSIAHELGHYVLNHRQSIARFCSNDDMMSWYNKTQETEANFFASELILPNKLLRPRCDVREVNFEPIKNIANEFRASMTATSIRFVRYCPEACAVVFSKDNKIIWSYRSEEWWPFIRSGKTLDRYTVASDFFVDKELPDEPVPVNGDAWLEDNRVEEVIEHSICSRKLNFVLSILWIPPR